MQETMAEICPFFPKWEAYRGSRSKEVPCRNSGTMRVSDCVFVSLAVSCPTPSAHGAHQPGGEVRTLLLLLGAGGRDAEPYAGLPLLLTRLGPGVGSQPVGLMDGGLTAWLIRVGTSLQPKSLRHHLVNMCWRNHRG